MKVTINKSTIKGIVAAPSSKSYTVRALMCAALAKGESVIINPLRSDDTDAAMNVLRKIGVDIIEEDGRWRVRGGQFKAPAEDLFCGDSAATLRFMTALCSIIPGECRLTAGPSLIKRPVKPLVDALQQMGVKASCSGDFPPVVVESDAIHGENVFMPGNISSQYVSALLLAAPFSQHGVTIELTTGLESRHYVAMTLECMQIFGVNVGSTSDLCEFVIPSQDYKPKGLTIEGDWSSSSYLLAAGALVGEITISNLDISSCQGDRVLLDYLREMGADVTCNGGEVTVRKRSLKAIDADLNECIDLLPTMSVLAALADGTSTFSGIKRARLKESDRIAAVDEGLKRSGIPVEAGENKITITGANPSPAIIDSHNDHRIAMAFSLLGLHTGGITIEGAECVSKTYPEFWEIVKSIGGGVIEDGK